MYNSTGLLSKDGKDPKTSIGQRMAKRTKWLRGLLRTKKQREADEAAKAAEDREAYEKGYPDRSR